MSILSDVKQSLGIDSELKAFDSEIIVHINSVLMSLNQIGIGPKTGFLVVTGNEDWIELTDRIDLTALKQYVYVNVRMIFDPPVNSHVMDALKNQANELTWRLNVQAETEDPKDL